MKIFLILVVFSVIASAQEIVSNPVAACQKLGASLASENVTVNFAEYVPARTNLTFTQAYNLSTCGLPSQVISIDLCRVAMYVATSYRSGE
jgi:feruloyl esterase